MGSPDSPNVWVMLFEHTPPVLRWVLGILTLGLFTMASKLWQMNQRKVIELEEAHKTFATHSDVLAAHDELATRIDGVDKKVDSLHGDVRIMMSTLIGRNDENTK